MANFSELLKDQKEKQDKETVAISEAAQSYSLQIQKEKGFGQSFIKGDKDNDPISNAAVSVVQQFQGELDTIADNDFTYLKDLIAKYNTFFEELPKSIDKERFTAKEGDFDRAHELFLSANILVMVLLLFILAYTTNFRNDPGQLISMTVSIQLNRSLEQFVIILEK